MAISRNLPNASVDSPGGSVLPSRTGRYGEAYVCPVGGGDSVYTAADEGSYCTFMTAVPGTGIINGTVQTEVETTPSFLIYNGSSNRVYLDFIRYYHTVVSTTTTRVQLTSSIDTTNRYTSSGTALTVNCVNSDVPSPGPAAGVLVYQGAISATAASANRRKLGHTIFRWGTIDVVGDVYEMQFGRGIQSTITPVATVCTFTKGFAPVVIGPGHSFLQINWAAGSGAGSTVFIEGGFWVR